MTGVRGGVTDETKRVLAFDTLSAARAPAFRAFFTPRGPVFRVE
ncbi:hypothetical protein ACFTSF_26905 [Kribbella sp. NPDC056951]